MVTVKLFGLLRLDSGLKELKVEAGSVRELFPLLLEEIRRTNSGAAITRADLEGCVVIINGKQGRKSSKLRAGDTVYLMFPVCGG